MSDDWSEPFKATDAEQDGYARFDEFSDVECSLELFLLSLKRAPAQPYFWKWAIVACHSAIGGACVCVLTRTDGGGALDKISEKALSQYHDFGTQKAMCEAAGVQWVLKDQPYPEARLAAFPELLDRLPTPLRISIGSLGERSPDYEKDIRSIHIFRNEFSHFTPKSWSIQIVGLPRILRHGLFLVKEIVQCDGYHGWNRFYDEDCRVAALLNEIEEELVRCDGQDI